MKKTKYYEHDLRLTLAFKLNMIEYAGEYAPEVKSISISIKGPEESRQAAEYFHENEGLEMPLVLAQFLSKIASDNSLHAAVATACHMVLDEIEM